MGRGKRSQFAAKDVFFMLLVVVKCGGTWEMLSNVFQIKTPTFIKTIVGFLEVVAGMRLRQAEECAKRGTGAVSAFVTPCTSTTVLVMKA